MPADCRYAPFWRWTQIFRALRAPVLDAAAGDRGTRFALFEEATAALRAAADHAPLLVVLDDLHRADEASLRLLDFVVDQLWPAAVAIVGTYRDAEVGGLAGDVLSGLVGTRHCDLLDVSGLTVDDVAGWLAAAGASTRAGGADQVHRRTVGNPLFIGEVLRLRDMAASQIPAGVREVIRRRLRMLPDRTRRVLATAAVLGRDFAEAPLAALLQEGPTSLQAALEPAIDAHLVTRDRGPGRYRFIHVLVQQTLESDLPAAERARLHAGAFAVLPFTAATDSGDLAHHAMLAADLVPPGQALDAVTAAAADADQRQAFEDAASWWEIAAELALPAGTGTPDRVRIRMSSGLSLLQAGSLALARSRFEEVARAAGDLDDGPLLAMAALAAGDTVAEIGPDRELIALLDEALARPGPGCRARGAAVHAAQPRHARGAAHRRVADPRSGGSAA